MNKEEIAALAADAFTKGEQVRMHAMLNSPVDFEERKQQAIAYALARAEWVAAKAKLDAATAPPPSPSQQVPPAPDRQ